MFYSFVIYLSGAPTIVYTVYSLYDTEWIRQDFEENKMACLTLKSGGIWLKNWKKQ